MCLTKMKVTEENRPLSSKCISQDIARQSVCLYKHTHKNTAVLQRNQSRTARRWALNASIVSADNGLSFNCCFIFIKISLLKWAFFFLSLTLISRMEQWQLLFCLWRFWNNHNRICQVNEERIKRETACLRMEQDYKSLRKDFTAEPER